jgi:hypothetical protein
MPNISFDGTPVEFEAPSGYVVLIDPLALDALAAEIGALAGQPVDARLRALAAMPGFLQVGVRRIPPGDGHRVQVTLDDFDAAGEMTGPEIVDIDSGAMILADLDSLPRLASVLTWDRYDWMLQAPLGDTSREAELTAEVGRPCFALIGGEADRAFAGDGAYRFRRGRPRRVPVTAGER